uniref:putative F-box/LRR-repeat protein 23 n=1 Tax=Erigeron canadensis TaxID=72917 RepID=UPI001CB97647|nr:putative F-box/LRR-repeat protein 23 [Erigeron canadensis]
MVDSCDDEYLRYVADRSSQLKHLDLGFFQWFDLSVWTEALKKLSLLEEFSVYGTDIPSDLVATLASYCPNLKTLKLNNIHSLVKDEMAIAIGESLPKLHHLELTWSYVSNIGLQAILDGCVHLESLDLRMCCFIDLKGQIGKRCSRQIKCLQRPNDPINIFHYGERVEYTTMEKFFDFVST